MLITNEKRWGTAGLAILFSAMLGLTGCGGGGGGGSNNNDDGGGGGGDGTINEQAATIQTEDDAKLGADAAVESSYQAVVEEETPDLGLGLPGGVAIEGESHHEWLRKHSLELSELGLAPAGASFDMEGDCGGNANVQYNEDFSDYRIVFDNYCSSGYQGDNYIMDGEWEWFGYENIQSGELEGEWGYDFDYTVTYRGETNRYQGSYRCNGNDFTSCSYTNNYAGRSGRSYRSENVNVSGDNSSGYSVSARVYDQELGYLDYQASNLVLCEGGFGFQSGDISVTDSSGSEVLSVVFSGCDSYTATYQGVSYTIDY